MLAQLDALDDDALLDRLRGGDDVAFRALVDRHRPWLVRLCTRLLGQDAHAAEDAAQESLLKLHRAARDGRPLRVRPWLTVVARHTCVDEQRRRRPDLPGELPERAAPGDDPFPHDAALTAAWSRLPGRHREVLYLREVLGFSYKEIGSVMGLTLPATETLIFRARAALRREYERSGGTSLGCGVLGFHLARLGLGRRQDVVAAGAPTIPLGEAGATGLTGLTSRLAQFLTALPGCGEQAAATALSVAAGVAVAVAAAIPGPGPFSEVPRAEAAETGVSASAAPGSLDPPTPNASVTREPVVPRPPAKKAPSLAALLGDAVPAGWTLQPSRRESTAVPAGSAAAGSGARQARATPLRDAVAAARPAARSEPDRAELPEQPLRTVLADSLAGQGDPLPAETGPALPAGAAPVPAEPLPDDGPLRPDRESRPAIRAVVDEAKDSLELPGGDSVAGHEPALLRRRHR